MNHLTFIETVIDRKISINDYMIRLYFMFQMAKYYCTINTQHCSVMVEVDCPIEVKLSVNECVRRTLGKHLIRTTGWFLHSRCSEEQSKTM